MARTKTLRTDYLARVEGEGAMLVKIRDGKPVDVKLRIYEPPRFFEAFLRGRAVHRGARHHRAHLRDLPGRLPDVERERDGGRLRRRRRPADPRAAPPPLLRRVDREPRAPRLHAPRARLPRLRERDRAGEGPPRARRARAAHEEDGQRGDDASSAAARCTRSTSGSAASTARRRSRSSRRSSTTSSGRASSRSRPSASPPGSTSPTSSRTTSSSRSPSRTPTRSRTAGSSRTAASTSRSPSTSSTSSRSTSSGRTRSTRTWSSGGNYLVGPLARCALSGDRLSPLAPRGGEGGRARARRAQPVPHDPGPLRRARLRRRRGAPPDRRVRAARAAPSVEVVPRAGVGYGCSEAPRGICWHRYEIDDEGTILDAKIVPPTSQNQKTIESDLRGVVERYADLPDAELSLRCEQAIRNYDPCISCATHFLKLEVDRG